MKIQYFKKLRGLLQYTSKKKLKSHERVLVNVQCLPVKYWFRGGWGSGLRNESFPDRDSVVSSENFVSLLLNQEQLSRPRVV